MQFAVRSSKPADVDMRLRSVLSRIRRKKCEQGEHPAFPSFKNETWAPRRLGSGGDLGVVGLREFYEGAHIIVRRVADDLATCGDDPARADLGLQFFE
jgi:hypothetical protein